MHSLVKAVAQRRSVDVVLKWTVQGALEDSREPWLLTATLAGEADGPIHTFGVRVVDRRVEQAWVFDYAETTNSYVSVNLGRTADTWTAVFPAGDEVARVGTLRASLRMGETDEQSVDGTF